MNENMQYSIDDMCNFFNKIESNYQRAPLQSTFIAKQLLPLKHHQTNMEEQIINICAKKKAKYKLPDVIINKYKAKFENCPKHCLEKDIYSNLDVTFQTNNDIDKGLELADDLLKSYDTYMRNIPPVQKQVEALSNTNMHSRNNNEPNQMENHINANKNSNTKNDYTMHNESTIEQQQVSKQMKFKTAKEQYIAEVTSTGGQIKQNIPQDGSASTGIKRILPSNNSNNNNGNKQSKTNNDEKKLPVELENFDKELVDKIEADIINRGQIVTFNDIAGLEFAKKCVTELICWPMTRPDLFKGLRTLPRGVLLFGPPGTGKTLIGKAIAHQSGATFFSISASSLMSKWIGEGEKTVRTLFAVAAYRQPSVVFLDEVDSLLCQRSTDENEATRRMKTEFMVQLDGANTNLDARVVIVGATNRPEELDEAVRRRFIKRIYIPLPDAISRECLLRTLLRDIKHSLNESDCIELISRTEGFSGADIRSLCTEAAMGPVREAAFQSKGNLSSINEDLVPPINVQHFNDAFEGVVSSVSPNDLYRYIEWNNSFGSFRKLN